eukprot:scaffold763_cov202-Alexandrium_tamarense.AAC.12
MMSGQFFSPSYLITAATTALGHKLTSHVPSFFVTQRDKKSGKHGYVPIRIQPRGGSDGTLEPVFYTLHQHHMSSMEATTGF